MTEPLAELLVAAERLAEAVDEFQEIANDSPPRRVEFDDGEEGEEEFRLAAEFYIEDQKAAKASLARALRNYRRAQESELCARAVARRA